MYEIHRCNIHKLLPFISWYCWWMEEILHDLGWRKPEISDAINDQPQQVTAGFIPSTGSGQQFLQVVVWCAQRAMRWKPNTVEVFYAPRATPWYFDLSVTLLKKGGGKTTLDVFLLVTLFKYSNTGEWRSGNLWGYLRWQKAKTMPGLFSAGGMELYNSCQPSGRISRNCEDGSGVVGIMNWIFWWCNLGWSNFSMFYADICWFCGESEHW